MLSLNFLGRLTSWTALSCLLCSSPTPVTLASHFEFALPLDHMQCLPRFLFPSIPTPLFISDSAYTWPNYIGLSYLPHSKQKSSSNACFIFVCSICHHITYSHIEYKMKYLNLFIYLKGEVSEKGNIWPIIYLTALSPYVCRPQPRGRNSSQFPRVGHRDPSA